MVMSVETRTFAERLESGRNEAKVLLAEALRNPSDPESDETVRQMKLVLASYDRIEEVMKKRKQMHVVHRAPPGYQSNNVGGGGLP
jgi:hypothetical protein